MLDVPGGPFPRGMLGSTAPASPREMGGYARGVWAASVLLWGVEGLAPVLLAWEGRGLTHRPLMGAMRPISLLCMVPAMVPSSLPAFSASCVPSHAKAKLSLSLEGGGGCPALPCVGPTVPGSVRRARGPSRTDSPIVRRVGSPGGSTAPSPALSSQLEATLDLAERRRIRSAIRELQRQELERDEEALASKRFRPERGSHRQDNKENWLR